MGDLLSTPSQPKPSSATAKSPMPSSTSPQATHQPKLEAEPAHRPKSPEFETSIQESSDPPTDTNSKAMRENPAVKETPLEKDSEELIKEGDGGGGDGEGEAEEEEEEEEGECGFCLFMKGGGCKDTFIEWEKCVEAGEKSEEDIVEKCFQVTAALKKCMEAHSDYYAPLLQAEKAAEEEALKQMERDKEIVDKQEGGGEESSKVEKEETLGGSEKKE